MSPKEVKNQYRSFYNFHKETRMSHSSLYNWEKWGYIPIASQMKIEKITEGKLKAEWEHDKQRG